MGVFLRNCRVNIAQQQAAQKQWIASVGENGPLVLDGAMRRHGI
jgi:hypothetical protein